MIERILYTHERDYLFEDLRDSKQEVDGVQCWSLRKLSNIFDLNYLELVNDLYILNKCLIQCGDRAGYSLSGIEYNALKERRARFFIKEIEVEASLDGYITEIEDQLINSYMLYSLADKLVYEETDVQRLKNFIMLESAQTFPLFEKVDE